ncbi:MAG TPA: DNA translocase FtsK, partial [Patescibacteria group bacterium]
EVITGLIKANIPTRIAFKVATQIDSRTILDAGGAEKLLGNGDMLFSSVGASGMRRLQGVYISENEVHRVVEFIKNQKFDKMEDDLEDEIVDSGPKRDRNGNGEVTSGFSGDKIDFAAIASNDQEDALYDDAKQIVIQMKKASTSLLQRRLRVGYSRAARLIDMLEDNGIIGPQDGAKPREVLVADGENHTGYEDAMGDQTIRDKWQM